MTSPAVIHADELFRKYSKLVAAFVRKLHIPDREVDDAVQEVFIVAHRLGGYIPGAAHPRTWLCAIALRIAANMRRRHARHTRGDNRSFHNSAEQGVTWVTPYTVLEYHQSVVKAEEILSSMNDMQRLLFTRFALEGQTCPQIAEELNIPVGTVYSRLHNVRQFLNAAEYN